MCFEEHGGTPHNKIIDGIYQGIASSTSFSLHRLHLQVDPDRENKVENIQAAIFSFFSFPSSIRVNCLFLFSSIIFFAFHREWACNNDSCGRCSLPSVKPSSYIAFCLRDGP